MPGAIPRSLRRGRCSTLWAEVCGPGALPVIQRLSVWGAGRSDTWSMSARRWGLPFTGRIILTGMVARPRRQDPGRILDDRRSPPRGGRPQPPQHVTGNGTEPRAEYTRRLEQRRRDAARHASADLAFSGARLGVVISAVLMAWLSLGSGLFSARWLIAPVALFLVLMFLHDRAIKRRRRAERAAALYEG